MILNISDEDASLIRGVLWDAFLNSDPPRAIADSRTYSRLDDYFDEVPMARHR